MNENERRVAALTTTLALSFLGLVACAQGQGTAGQTAAQAPEPPTIYRSNREQLKLVTVKADEATKIAGYSTWDNSCKERTAPVVTVLEAPRHGAIETRPGLNRITQRRFGNSICNGEPVRGTEVMFTPAKDYVGEDVVVLGIGSQNGFARDTVRITIQKPAVEPIATAR